MNDYLDRSKQLLGEDRINALADKVILVIGIGGVGGTALEALARSGFKNFILTFRTRKTSMASFICNPLGDRTPTRIISKKQFFIRHW